MPRKASAEFVVLNIGAGLTAGSTATVVGVTGTLEKARELVKRMSPGGASKIAILKKEKLILRRPTVELEESDASIQDKHR